MERITSGVLLKDYISGLDPARDGQMLERLTEHAGKTLAKMHDADVIHGDLTTSNMIYDAENQALTLIDFGLSHVSSLAEDKGVDLFVLEKAFLSTHPSTESCFQMLLQSYSEASKDSKAVIHKLDEVRLRGRKRTMVG